MSQGMRLLFIVTESHYFLSHRLTLALAAQAAGYEVHVACNCDAATLNQLQKYNFRIWPLRKMLRSRMNPLKELTSIWEFCQLIKQIQPDIVHNIAMKPVIYASIAARINNTKKIINTLPGMGYIFTSNEFKARLVRPWLLLIFRWICNFEATTLIVQNSGDYHELQNKGIAAAKLKLIAGSGVEVFNQVTVRQAKKKLRVTYAGRMLADKGVYDLIAAIKIIKALNLPIEFHFYGATDPQNPSSIADRELFLWQQQGLITFHGQVASAELWQGADITVLASYREGLPKSLLEAAMQRVAIIATDIPGCRQLIRHRHNGLLVPCEDPLSIALAIKELYENSDLRTQLLSNAHSLVQAEFTTDIINRQFISQYRAEIGAA